MLTDLLSTQTKAEIDHWVSKYPSDQKRSAVLSALHAAQAQNQGWLTADLMRAVAAYLAIPDVWVTQVATFYDMYELAPCGKHKIRVCSNISCMLNGAQETIKHLEKRLGIKIGQSTDDGKYQLIEAECLAACASAPMMQIDNKYYENLTPEYIDRILEDWEDNND